MDWVVAFMQQGKVYRTTVVHGRTEEEAVRRALMKGRICIGFYTNIQAVPL